MIKENQKYLNRLQIVLDMSLVIADMGIAYWGRFVLLDGNISLTQEQIIKIVGWTFRFMVFYIPNWDYTDQNGGNHYLKNVWKFFRPICWGLFA